MSKRHTSKTRKTTDRASSTTNSPSLIAPIVDARLRAIENDLISIAAMMSACEAADPYLVAGAEADEIARVAKQAALRSLAEIYWLRSLPESVLNRPAPTTDELEAAEAAQRREEQAQQTH